MPSYLWPVVEAGRPTGTRVTDVVDGDTIDAVLVEPVAFGGQLTHRVRLRVARINAAKGRNPKGIEATRELMNLLEDPGNLVVAITTVKPYKYGGPAGLYRGDVPGGPVDYGGEYLAEVELADGTFVSDRMVEAGQAVYWDGTGPRPADQLRGERIG